MPMVCTRDSSTDGIYVYNLYFNIMTNSSELKSNICPETCNFRRKKEPQNRYQVNSVFNICDMELEYKS